jgi:hypothetical protein
MKGSFVDAAVVAVDAAVAVACPTLVDVLGRLGGTDYLPRGCPRERTQHHPCHFQGMLLIAVSPPMEGSFVGATVIAVDVAVACPTLVLWRLGGIDYLPRGFPCERTQRHPKCHFQGGLLIAVSPPMKGRFVDAAAVVVDVAVACPMFCRSSNCCRRRNSDK